MPDIGVCNHETCKCPTTDDGKFCCDQCGEAAEHTEVPGTMCGCGHESCG